MVWKNGRGFTDEIDRQPNDNQEELDWRLSMATIKYPGGPFSIFDNIDRTLSMIDGQDLILKLNNNTNDVIHIDKNSSPYSFPGEISITCQIHEDILIDFNVMTKRDKFRHTVERIILKKDENPMNISNLNKDIFFVIVAQGSLEINENLMRKGDAFKLIDDKQSIQI